MREARTRRRRAAAGTAMLVFASCAGAGATLPEAPPVVEVTMDEFRFKHPAPSKSGRLVFRLRNGGRIQHEAVLVKLPHDFPPIDEQLRGRTRRAVETVASLPPRQPGRGGFFAVELTPGRYALICFVTDPDGRQHSAKGMSSEFRLTG